MITPPRPNGANVSNTHGALDPQDRKNCTASFDSFEEYEAWEELNLNEPDPDEQTIVERFWETADLSDAIAKLNPYKREHFVISFDNFEEYEAWKNGQTNPWNW